MRILLIAVNVSPSQQLMILLDLVPSGILTTKLNTGRGDDSSATRQLIRVPYMSIWISTTRSLARFPLHLAPSLRGRQYWICADLPKGTG